jgi:hypothetical protein
MDFSAKTPNELPQKHQTLYRKNTKRFTAKTTNESQRKLKINFATK